MKYKIILTEEDYRFMIRQMERLIEAGGKVNEIKQLVWLLNIFEYKREEVEEANNE